MDVLFVYPIKIFKYNFLVRFLFRPEAPCRNQYVRINWCNVVIKTSTGYNQQQIDSKIIPLALLGVKVTQNYKIVVR